MSSRKISISGSVTVKHPAAPTPPWALKCGITRPLRKTSMGRATPMHTPHLFKLSRQLARPLVVFDIEHTGSKKEERGITEFASFVIDGASAYPGLNSFINPGQGIYFNPFAMKKTGISQKTVAKAPAWHDEASDYVLQHQDCIWIGFSSRKNDIPIIQYEHQRYGLALPEFKWQLDVMSLARGVTGRNSGSLGSLLEELVPGKVRTAHRAMADVLMTMDLLEHLLPSMPAHFLESEGLLPSHKPPAPRQAA